MGHEKLMDIPNNSTEYVGELQSIELNSYQELLFKRAMFGLSAYPKKKLDKMHWEKKRRIKNVNKKALKSVNMLKQEQINRLCKDLSKHIFSGSPVATELLEKEALEVDFTLDLNFRKLKIDKNQLIDRFISEGILPQNFYQIS